MEKEIKELRVQIDGLAKLTQSLEKVTIFSTNCIPDGMTIPEAIHCMETTGRLGNLINSVEIEKNQNIASTVQSLYFAKAWLGKVLAELGSENPYKSGYKTKEDIESASDVAKIIPGMITPFTNNNTEEVEKCVDTWKLNGIDMSDWQIFTYIEKIDWLRTEIEKLIVVIKEIQFLHSTRELNIARTNSYNYLCEAKFYLGFELQKIKES